MAWSEQARKAALESRRRKLKRLDLRGLKPKTQEILRNSRVHKNKYWVGPDAKLSRAGLAKDLRRSRAWKRSKKAGDAFQRHLERTRGFD